MTPGWSDISGPGPVSFLPRSSMYYIMPLCIMQLAPINNSDTKLICSYFSLSRENSKVILVSIYKLENKLIKNLLFLKTSGQMLLYFNL